MQLLNFKDFKNGSVYALNTYDNYPLEISDTFLPYCTKNAIKNNNNYLKSNNYGNRKERWMIGVSCMSGCPVKCKFCATGNLKKYRNLTTQEIIDQVEFILNKNKNYQFNEAKEHKINYTRMGEPFLNIENVRKAIEYLDSKHKGIHHYISTIGIKNSDFSWIKDNITLQISLHSLNEERRNNLIPFKNKAAIEELGHIRVKSFLKITLNLTLVDEKDFDIDILYKYFDPKYFFVKLSPVNVNEVSKRNSLGKGIIQGINYA